MKIYECAACGLVYLSSFDHIHKDFYQTSGMHQGEVDTEAWLKETAGDDQRRFQNYRRLMENKDLLDFGCGNGGFLLRARDAARTVCGIEPEAVNRPWFSAQGLDVFSSIGEVPGLFDIITAFHVVEHLPDPASILNELSSKLHTGGQLIIEVPNANDALLSLFGSEPFSHFTYWSCHLYLFSNSTLAALAQKSGLRVNYIKQIQRYPLSNHLYWLAMGRPGGHTAWSFLDSDDLHQAYEKQLASLGRCDTILASLSRT